MSTRDLTQTERELITGADFSPPEPVFECDSNPPARVYVGGTRIPVINNGVRTEIRKDGAMGLTRYSEVFFPREWGGEAFENAVRALDPNEANVYDPVDIQFRDYGDDGEYKTVHRGFVMGVGGGGRGDLERRMTVGDVGQLLGGMPIDQEFTYEAGTEIEDVIADIIDQIELGGVVPKVFSSIEFNAIESEAADTDSLGLGNTIDFADAGLTDVTPGIGISILVSLLTRDRKEFEPNKHTVADIIAWIEDRLEGYFYFRPPEGSSVGESDIELVYDQDPGFEFTANHLDENGGYGVQIYKNNALYEIRPINQYLVNGAVTTSTTTPGAATDPPAETTKQYPQAIVQHEQLAELANVPLRPPDEHADEVTTVAGAEKRAIEGLKNALDESGLGAIEMAPSPRMRPYSTIKSLLACGEERSEDSEPFEYEVESVVHNARATTDRDQRYHATTVQCSIPHKDEHIEVKESQMIDIESESRVTLGDLIDLIPGI